MDIRSMDPQSVQELFDVPVVGPDGESVGTVEQIFADDVTGAPTFITVRNGDRECYIPVSGADLDAHTVTIPFSKDVVDAAPSAVDAEDLSLEQETSLYRYYGIRPPRRSSVGTGEHDEAAAGDDVTPSHAQSDEEDEAYQRPSDEENPAALDEPVLGGQEAPAEEPDDENEFRSIEEIDESQDPAAPESTTDELPAEEAAVLDGPDDVQPVEAAGDESAEETAGIDSAADQDAEETADQVESEDVVEPADEAEQAPEESGEESVEPADVAETAAVAGVAGMTGAAVSEDASSQADEVDPLDALIVDPGDVDKADPEGVRAVPEPDELGDVVLPAGAKLRKYVVTEMVTVQVPVRREVVCYQDADGVIHELRTVPAPAPAAQATPEDSGDPED
ncbi:PRC-barrel domain-containing protein [Acidipropionibacterium jensenii]|uniref:PRC-barrel domain-containing protein n=1 Tax=Acidipropionibacterium jensenii TaxID=1749 RepID=UPI002648BA24|nr:PRC-barrel domain-containing protein [Acidipropionibacterium jensenii]MDN5977029.1 PRC-barrel domain-containing protein [Acidipropionibacterium jensenii]MDN5996694.1 PRC-barrel domain-containing protein [Acidipropionibacterium jensenii]MDN6021114.1 PRC-barrel domain-containing protein [Acidipropionibacterium jensenii]MDN6440939.1 PRC-barrel domain-containing protein [Acidipropionibacterium jensenii]MDN6592834.1 PRC-barrel domain-containing protein [Acidipropionibacterium jensenii]